MYNHEDSIFILSEFIKTNSRKNGSMVSLEKHVTNPHQVRLHDLQLQLTYIKQGCCEGVQSGVGTRHVCD